MRQLRPGPVPMVVEGRPFVVFSTPKAACVSGTVPAIPQLLSRPALAAPSPSSSLSPSFAVVSSSSLADATWPRLRPVISGSACYVGLAAATVSCFIRARCRNVGRNAAIVRHAASRKAPVIEPSARAPSSFRKDVPPLEETLRQAYGAALQDLVVSGSAGALAASTADAGGPRWTVVADEPLCNGSAYYTQLRIDPLPRGQARIVGNILRRTLLRHDFFRTHAAVAFKVSQRAFFDSSGAATLCDPVPAVHEFASVPGVQESLIDVVRNVQQLRVRRMPSRCAAEVAEGEALPEPRAWEWSLRRCGPCAVQARDLSVVDSAAHYEEPLEMVEPDQHIMRLSMPTAVDLEVQAVCCTQKEWEESAVYQDYKRFLRYSGWLIVPPIFSPVKKVNYQVAASSAPDAKDGDEAVLLEIWTTPSGRPQELLRNSAASLLATLKAENREVAAARA